MLNISNVQHFSVGDGPGIRTTVFFKGCNLWCPWCHNPENLTAEPVTLRYESPCREETVGKRMTAEELLPELREDIDFYEESGGGVTLSGGEAMLQATELLPLVKKCREEGIPVLIDTAGCVPYASFEALNPWVDGYLFDVKTADPAAYESIGGDLAQITENLRRLLQEKVRVFLRIPLIPGFNTAPAQISALCAYLRELGVDSVALLPFHRLGSGKYRAMGLQYPYADQTPLSKKELAAIQTTFGQFFKVTIE